MLIVVVRNEADIVGDLLDYHLGAGVDLALVTDHRSSDGTREILEGYARAGSVRVFTDDRERIHQGEWMTRLARIAAGEHDADWVLCGDADEFWWGEGGHLSTALAAVPERYGVVHALSQPFLPGRDEQLPIAERMTIRLAQTAPLNSPLDVFRPVTKVAHRASDRVVVGLGNHQVSGVPGDVLHGWYPLEILHLPVRTRAQCARKYRTRQQGWQYSLGGDVTPAGTPDRSGSSDAVYERMVPSAGSLAAGLANGCLVRDTRLRDALRRLRGQGAGPASLTVHGRLPIDVAVQAEAEAARLQRSLDALAHRVQRLSGDRRRLERRSA